MHSVLCLFMQTQCKCRRSRVAIDLSQNGRVQVRCRHDFRQLGLLVLQNPAQRAQLQSPVKCLDHRCCGRDNMQSCKAVVGCAMH